MYRFRLETIKLFETREKLSVVRNSSTITETLVQKNKIPEDGFEPPLEDPESPVLPLDDSGIINYEIILSLQNINTIWT